jgi:hypothetical protein
LIFKKLIIPVRKIVNIGTKFVYEEYRLLNAGLIKIKEGKYDE